MYIYIYYMYIYIYYMYIYIYMYSKPGVNDPSPRLDSGV